MTYRQTALMVFCACIMMMCLLYIMQRLQRQRRRQTKRMIMNGVAPTDIHNDTISAISHLSFFQRRNKKIQGQLDELYDIETTPEDIFRFQFLVAIVGTGITFLMNLLFHTVIMTAICISVTMLLFFAYDFLLKSRVQAKRDEFDRILPQYESNLLLGLQAGSGIQNAMKMATRTVPDGLVKIEFGQLMNERSRFADNEARPYMNLAKRVPTKDCERFCNIIISGIKNGNSMSEILTQESEYMTQQQLNKIKEIGEKNSLKATAVSTVLIFFPIICLFIVPMMANSM